MCILKRTVHSHVASFTASGPQMSRPTSAGCFCCRDAHLHVHSGDIYPKRGALSTNITISAHTGNKRSARGWLGWGFWTKWKLTVLILAPLGTRWNWLIATVPSNAPRSWVEGTHLSLEGSHRGPPAGGLRPPQVLLM